MNVTVSPCTWDAIDPVGRFLVSATALLDRAVAEGVSVAIGGPVICPADGTESALVAMCRALRLPMTPDTADVSWARAQRVATDWNRDLLSDGLLLWIEDMGREAVIV